MSGTDTIEPIAPQVRARLKLIAFVKGQSITAEATADFHQALTENVMSGEEKEMARAALAGVLRGESDSRGELE